MRRLLRFALPLGLVAMLAVPVGASAQANVKTSGLTLLANSPKTGTTNSDFAFWGDTMVAGNYAGIRVFDISNPAAPILLSDFACAGSQGDVTMWRNLVFRSIDSQQSTDTCTGSVNSGGGFEGIRIIDISNPAAPVFVKAVPTDCGSHTNTLIPDLKNNRVLLYVSSYPLSGLGTTRFGTTCQVTGTGHDKISIVEVPLNAPQNARVIATPKLGLSADFIASPGVKGCHDISVFMPLKIAAGACLSEGVIMDISNPAAPVIKQRLANPAIDTCARTAPIPPASPLCLWHSATFTWDGKYVVFGDEAGGGGSAECQSTDPETRGAFWIHSLANPTAPIGRFKTPRAQDLANENCTAHIMNFIPVRGSYIMPSSWYSAGTSVVNWTSIASPQEIAYFEIDNAGPTAPTRTNTWASYWYNGYIYANDEGRGVDIFDLAGPWRQLAWRLPHYNPQTQEDLIRCRVVSHGPRIRAKRMTMVHTIVTVLGNQPVRGAKIRLRGAGVTVQKTTNAQGEAMFMVKARRAGTLRIVVPDDLNMLGCNTSRRVAAAPRKAVRGGGAGLTGRIR